MTTTHVSDSTKPTQVSRAHMRDWAASTRLCHDTSPRSLNAGALSDVLIWVMSAVIPKAKQACLFSSFSAWLTLYRQLFIWIVAFNVTALVLGATGVWGWASRHRVQFAVTNTLITVLTRNEVCYGQLRNSCCFALQTSEPFFHARRYVRVSCTWCWSSS